MVQSEHLPANINQHIARLRVNLNRCLPKFLSEWLNCPAGLALSNRPISGGTRAALDYGAIRSIRVPLPPLAEQERLVAGMETARAQHKAMLAEADALLAGIDNFVLDALGITPLPEDNRRVFGVMRGAVNNQQLSPSNHAPELRILMDRLRGYPWATQVLREYVDINPKPELTDIDDQETVGFIPMPAVSDGATGEYTFTERPLEEVRKGYTPFADGDILWAKITPCMQNGKSCIVEGLPNGVGFGSTEFHVLRVRDDRVSKEFVKEFVSQKALRQVATYVFTGSAGQQRVPAEFLTNLPFPAIPREEQGQIVATIEDTRAEARRLLSEAETGWQEAKRWFEGQLLG